MKSRPKALNNLQLTIANMALEKTNMFLVNLQKRISKADANDKATLNAIIRKEVQKNLELQQAVKTGKKKALVDYDERQRLRQAIDTLESSRNALSKSIKTADERYRKLEDELRTGTDAARKSQARLRQKDLEIEQLNKEILTVAKISSHDLQEPLKNIQVFTSLLLDKERDNLSPQGKDYFARMQKSAARIRKLMQDLSEYSLLNKSFYKIEKADLNKLLQQARKELETGIGQTRATITADSLPYLHVVPFHFKKIFKEMLCNAITFTRKGVSPKIRITCNLRKGSTLKELALSPYKSYYAIAFSDNGRGFESHYGERIFEVFQKLDTQGGSGSGIGLATCKKIIENYDGRITAHGIPGKGSTFTIYIAKHG